jgi:hypothetical protein
MRLAAGSRITIAPAVRQIARKAARATTVSPRFVTGIVTSVPFQMCSQAIEDTPMIISKIALPRRTFLRGLGAAVALPVLDAMVPAMTVVAQTAAKSIAAALLTCTSRWA